MQKYINQLLADIEAAAFYDKKAQNKFTKEDETDAYFAEVERFIHETPTQTLGSQIGLERIQFPAAESLTLKQCEQLLVALKKTYYNCGIALVMPDSVPVKLRYQAMVEALEEKVFLEEFGTCNIECCHYDFEGYCAFGMKRCPCFKDWEEEVLHLKQQPLETLEEMEALEVYWYNFLMDYEACKTNFEHTKTPKYDTVQQLLQQLEKAYQVIHKEEVNISFGAKEEDLPEGDYRTLFDWLEVGRVDFPKFTDLNDLELEVLTQALVQLIGKQLLILTILDWSLEQQYQELVTHFSRWMKREYPYFRLICQPQSFTLYDKVNAAPKKFRSEYDEFLAGNNGIPNDLLWFQQRNSETDDELPF